MRKKGQAITHPAKAHTGEDQKSKQRRQTAAKDIITHLLLSTITNYRIKHFSHLWGGFPTSLYHVFKSIGRSLIECSGPSLGCGSSRQGGFEIYRRLVLLAFREPTFDRQVSLGTQSNRRRCRPSSSWSSFSSVYKSHRQVTSVDLRRRWQGSYPLEDTARVDGKE
jgi:hypothetical protein